MSLNSEGVGIRKAGPWKCVKCGHENSKTQQDCGRCGHEPVNPVEGRAYTPPRDEP